MATVVQSRTNQATDNISFPVVTYFNAASRDDLRDPENVTQRITEQGVVTQRDLHSPQKADTGTDNKAPHGLGASFDFRLTAPPEEAIPSSAGWGGSPLTPKMIGIALGSPGILDSQEGLPPPRFTTSVFAQPPTGQSPPRKSKWKKIGGIFRAKNALASPTQTVTPDQGRDPRPNETPLANQQHIKRRKGSTEEWPRIEVDPTKTEDKHTSPQRSRKCSLSTRKPQRDKPESQLPRLDVNIPDFQMERYSVMFGNVMDKNQRPNLLARRAKTLDSLSVPNNQPFVVASAKPPPVPIRRATSPARSSFTLFPNSNSQPSKAAKFFGTQNIPQNFSRGPSPLLRANTIALESPSRSPLQPPPRGIHNHNNNNSVSSIRSSLGNVLSSQTNTPRSSNSYMRKEDKPLPAIKPEPPTQPRSRKMSPQDIRAVQSSLQQEQSESQKGNKPPAKEHSRRKRPDLTINTGQEPPPPPAKDAKEKSSTNSAINTIGPPPKITAEPIVLTESPEEVLAPRRNPLRLKTSTSSLGKIDTKPNSVLANTTASPADTSGHRQIPPYANTVCPLDRPGPIPNPSHSKILAPPLEMSESRLPRPREKVSPADRTAPKANALPANILASPLEMQGPKPYASRTNTASPVNRSRSTSLRANKDSPLERSSPRPIALRSKISASPLEISDPRPGPLSANTASPVEGPRRIPLRVDTASPVDGSSQIPLRLNTVSPVEGLRQIPLRLNSASPVENSRRIPLRVNTASPVEGPRRIPIRANTASPLEKLARPIPLRANTSSPLEQPHLNATPVRAESSHLPIMVAREESDPKEPHEQMPTIEVSTARSISVKRGKGARQMLVPIGSRVDHFNTNERFVDRKTLTPRITDVHGGHKHAKSQELQIESV